MYTSSGSFHPRSLHVYKLYSVGATVFFYINHCDCVTSTSHMLELKLVPSACS